MGGLLWFVCWYCAGVFFLTASAELHWDYRHPTCIHLWTWREFLSWTADKATLKHYTIFWAIYIYHVELICTKLKTIFISRQINRASTAQLLGALASIRERTGRTGCEAKATDNCQHFIRRQNVTQGKLNLNKRCKFLAIFRVFVAADRHRQSKRTRQKTLAF